MAANFRRGLRFLSVSQPSTSAVRQMAFSTNVPNFAQKQQGFEGLQAGFVWDHKNGFGYTKDGKVVIVSPQEDVDISTPAGVENDQTASILEVAQETFKEAKSPEVDPE